MQTDHFRAMDTSILLACENPQPNPVFDRIHNFIETCEQRFTRFSPHSELAQLNLFAGEWFPASCELYGLLQNALECYYATNGLFDPSILPDLERIGYTRSLDQIRSSGADLQPASAHSQMRPPFSAIGFRPEDLSIRLPRGMQIDLGGIAKGWVAERAARRLENFSPACAVNIGGDLFLSGHPSGKPSWEVVIEDPRNPELDLVTVPVEAGAVATSSVVKRVWQQGNLPRHHLIDPRTGQPAETFWLSVTAFASRGAVAEAFAKAILIGGPGFAQTLVWNNPQISYLAVDREGHIWLSDFPATLAGLKPPAQRMEAVSTSSTHRFGLASQVGFNRLSCTEAGF
jgi:FAD:protein FMN transferase